MIFKKNEAKEIYLDLHNAYCKVYTTEEQRNTSMNVMENKIIIIIIIIIIITQLDFH